MTPKKLLNRVATQALLRLGLTDAQASDLKRDGWWWLSARAGAAKRRVGTTAGQQVVWTGQGRAELLDVVVANPAAGEVTVRTAATIVSPGTERAQYLRLPNTGAEPPFKPGYTGAGVVEAVGRGVRGIAPGDRVAVRGLGHGSRATVPASRTHPVPEGVALEDAAFVQLGVICAQGVRHARLAGGERVCVLGAGLIGLLTQRLAQAAGAGETIVVARSRAKESLALKGGATRFLATADGDDAAGLDADVVFEATGDPRALAAAVAAVRDRGTIVLVGSSRGVTPDVPLAEIVARGLTLVGAHVETLTWESRMAGGDLQRDEAERFLGYLADGSVAVADLVSIVADPREPELVYREVARGNDLVSVRFDWTRVGAEPAGRLVARGIEPTRPLRAPARERDPFAGAEGRLRIGLLGCGDIAVHNAAAAVAAPNVELVAAFDPVAALAQDVAQAFGARAEASAEALVAGDDVDAVFVCVPHHLHLPLGRLAAEAGKHLIVEKPLANDLASARELADAAADAGVVLSVCFPQRYQSEVVEARRLIAAGAIGPIAGTSVKLLMDKPPSYWAGGFSGRAITTWRSSRAQAGGGVLIMNLSHYIDLVRHVTGLEAASVAGATSVVDGPAEVEDTVSVTLAYEGGGAGTVLGCAALRGLAAPETDVQLWGPEARIVLEPRAAAMSLRSVEGRRARRWYALPQEPVDIRAVYLSRLSTAIARGEQPDVTVDDALAVQAIMEAVYRSADGAGAVDPAGLLRA